MIRHSRARQSDPFSSASSPETPAPPRAGHGDGATYSWSDLPRVALALNGEPLSLDQTLGCGQAFRWWRIGEERWEGVAGGRAWRLELGPVVPDDRLPQERLPHPAPRVGRRGEALPLAAPTNPAFLLARCAPPLSSAEATAFLRSYFGLARSVRAIQRAVAGAHPAAAAAVDQFAGLRLLRQDPLETILTFTIATATNVPRVTRGVREVCARFGRRIAVVDGAPYHDFPTPDAILGASVDELFGPCNLAYRARAIQAVARTVVERPPEWLDRLRALPYTAAHAALDDLPFYGPKVSDCVCLFGLGFDEAVPVDIHVWAIAHELFGEDIPTRTLTPLTYRRIGDRFRQIFGSWAGWAQQYLFCARRAIPPRERFRLR